MKSLHLSISFASQSSTELRVSQRIEEEQSLIALVEGRGYPASGTIGVGSLRPHRHYRVCGAAQGFCRATADGSVMIALSIDQPSLLVLTSVI